MLNVAEKGAYAVLLDLMYDRRGPVPDDDPQWLARVIGCPTRTWTQVIKPRLVALDKIQIDGKQIGNRRALKQIYSESNSNLNLSKNGTKGAQKRWGSGENNDLAENRPIADGMAEPMASRARPEARGQRLEDRDNPTDLFNSENPSPGAHAPGGGNGKSKTPKGPPPEHPQFAEFWEAYPIREGDNPRKPAVTCFARAVSRGADPQALIAAVENYAATARAMGKEGTQFIARATTWLNEERWKDEPKEPGSPMSEKQREGLRVLEEHNAQQKHRKN